MDVRIGVTQSVKELELELADGDRDAVIAEIEAKLGTGEGTFSLTDKKGRTVLLPVSKVAYVEVGEKHDARKVGFAR